MTAVSRRIVRRALALGVCVCADCIKVHPWREQLKAFERRRTVDCLDHHNRHRPAVSK